MSAKLEQLFAVHDEALAAFDAVADEDWSNRVDTIGHALDAARDAILDHRPGLDEIAAKAAFMAGRRTFAEWDNFDRVRLITALTPNERSG